MPLLPRTALAATALVTLGACTSTANPAEPADAPSSPTASPSPTAATPTPVAHPGWVTGSVVDDDGLPVAGAMVEVLRRRDVPEAGLLQDRTPRRAWTGPDGTFRVRQSRDGYLVRACYPVPGTDTVCQETAQGTPYLWAYAGPDGTSSTWVTQTSLFAPSERDRRVGRLVVAPPSTVVGRLDGGAFSEVRVMRLNDTPAFRTQADAEGRYRITGLADGPYYVAAGGAGTLPWRSATFDLGRGRTHRVPAARLEPGATLSGTLTTAGGVAAGTDVLIGRGGTDYVAATTTDRAGRFRVSGFTAGRYRVGVVADGGRYRPGGRWVRVARDTGTYDASLRVRVGATVVVPLQTPGATGRVRDELRDASGRPVATNVNTGRSATYVGLAPGRYTVVAATADRFARTTVDVTGAERVELAPLRLDRPTYTLTGTTSPRAVVEATTGDLCPPGGPVRSGGFHLLDKAAADGSFEITGLVPGTYMLGADGWPGSFAPRCWSGVEVTGDLRHDLPLQEGVRATGRLVYADSGRPVITSLSYELVYDDVSPTTPTDEHPSRAKADATGGFTIPRLNAGGVHGSLASSADLDRITSLKFTVLYPFQDGSPHWLESDTSAHEVTPGEPLSLGDIPLVVRP